ncbi:hypothetical protein KMW28_21590 [Flammeovirga yaeyamensis]|uniref:Uncharacterized protein n=1 Tax=Flammeovirga yaeyamensis TaxID=367791 RepID=A0AAX1NBR9_9BACT|nr:hypothetical protein [Flammeovirga yaeyamensis]MBB3697053.1 cell division protein FtsI/penicillin-binding protein 2 [Flammeovirga yaeyamensis]NMF33715.1 hypothetical protein [Flammeovirga yaeyamensis]QWG05019.1 hypothetical protein KMW28_21590 [Flammeovirga yaeyamensis]
MNRGLKHKKNRDKPFISKTILVIMGTSMFMMLLVMSFEYNNVVNNHQSNNTQKRSFMIHNIVIDPPRGDSTRNTSDSLTIYIDDNNVWAGNTFEAINSIHDIELTSGEKTLSVLKDGQKIKSQSIILDNDWNFYQITIVHRRVGLETNLNRFFIEKVLFEDIGLD